ncbi:hypothetical protein Poly30_25070 [Planctomycetes bacterium Poly30]|uniref:ABC-2 family transporter protein n=1 Tax=Saltatorellus ferox TaxID=2528018 RepID=A0A518ESC2_9BACT|nr:hypothetical protein Poly30_25070 [Planctomycetes bacterium Poly30]
MTRAEAKVSSWESDARTDLALLVKTVGYEFRKRIQFRTGFFVREVLNGMVQPLVMLFVFAAIYRSASASGDAADATLGSWQYSEIVRYVAGLLIVMKLVFNARGLDLSAEIFEGRITKYLTMPFRYFVLIQGRFVQFTIMQVVVATLVWCLAYALMGDRWLVPVSWLATGQALTLVLLGSYCCFLLTVILNTLAFWLDVVWSLLVMAWFVISFVGGAIMPVSQMPVWASSAFSWLFPYWMISAPIEILMGRLGTDAFLRGLAIVTVQLVLLDALRRFTWRRGLAHYVGAGM